LGERERAYYAQEKNGILEQVNMMEKTSEYRREKEALKLK
jgi:hypothetical protein